MAKQSKAQLEERPYHHGDLQRAVVTAALEILAETQSTEFSLRELARRAGVSHNAPYKHFADKRELLSAVSAAGFEVLVKRVADMKQRSDPRARLLAIARAYVRHGVENPALYRLMFGGYLAGPDGRPTIEVAAGDKLRQLLAGTIIEGALGAPIPATSRNFPKIYGAILVFWSQLHGLTLLLIDGLVGPSDKAEDLCDRVVQGMLDGLTERAPSVPSGVWVGPRLPAKSDRTDPAK
jgi:AcrR family transcriptional regulator